MHFQHLVPRPILFIGANGAEQRDTTALTVRFGLLVRSLLVEQVGEGGARMADTNLDFEREMLSKEAEWVCAEMQDFNRLVQRYRYTCVAALFASMGWLLGQAVGHDAGVLANLPTRPDVAGILCMVPMVVGVFTLLIMEAARKVQALARYRFLLAVKLGERQPVWRWELFRRPGEEGYIRGWENSANLFFTALLFIVCVACYLVSKDGAYQNHLLWWLWKVSLGFFGALLVAIAFAAWPRRWANDVADPVVRPYERLRIMPRK